MITALLGALTAGLSLWDHQKRQEFLDRKISLEEQWHAEFQKDPSIRDQSILDQLESQLCILASEWAAIVASSKNATA